MRREQDPSSHGCWQGGSPTSSSWPLRANTEEALEASGQFSRTGARDPHLPHSLVGGSKSPLSSTAALAKFSLTTPGARSSQAEPTEAALCSHDSKALSTWNSAEQPTGQKTVFRRAMHLFSCEK